MQFILVADWYSNKVVLLSTTLEFVRYIGNDVSQPTRLYFDQVARRLYVSQSQNSSVLRVIQL